MNLYQFLLKVYKQLREICSNNYNKEKNQKSLIAVRYSIFEISMLYVNRNT